MTTEPRMISKVLYSLKRKYPAHVVIHRRTSETVDLETGVKTPVVTSWDVKRVIKLPMTLDRKFIYDLSFIASNKNFTYGGLFDTGTTKVILDTQELPTGWLPSRDDYYVMDGIRYEVKDFTEFALRGWVVILKSLIGQPRELASSQHVRSTLHMADSAAGVVE